MFRDTDRSNIVGLRMRQLRERLGLSQERVGVAIGIDESSSRARISRYELGVHEPPTRTARMIADAFGVPLAYLYCEDDEWADLLWLLSRQPSEVQRRLLANFLEEARAACPD